MTSTTVRPGTDSRRQARYEARRVLWRESSLKRVRSCGHHAVNEGGVAIKASGAGANRAAGLAGLASCGSVWACPWCSAKVSGHRQAELRQALASWHGDGIPGLRHVVMVTLTMRHRDGQSLASLWDANSYAWGAVTSGRAWQSEQREHAVGGWCRVVEVTHGKNGWHVHVHALLFLEGGDPVGVDLLGAQMFTRWRDALVRKGFAAPLSNLGGLDVKLLAPGTESGLADYFTKTVYGATEDQAALEVARGDLKDGRQGNRSPFQVLRDVVALGDADDLDLWHEWEAGSLDRRQMTWARGFRAQLVAAPDLTDQEVAELDQGGDVVVAVRPDAWPRWRDRGHDLLVAAEADDTGDLVRALLGADAVAPDAPSAAPLLPWVPLDKRAPDPEPYARPTLRQMLWG